MTERPDERNLNAMFRVDTGAGAHNRITVANRPQRKPEIIMRTTNLITATALAASLAVGGIVLAPAFGQDAKPDARAEANARLSITQVHEKVRALGYQDIDEIERDRGVYEVEAATSAGERVKLYVDAGSGEILRTKSEARDRGGDRKRMGRQADRATPDCTDRRCRDDRVQTIPSESMGWYLGDIYGRLKAAGV
jgi:hypothetical protein